MIYKRNCKRCNKEFLIGKFYWKLYCCKKCQILAKNKRYKTKARHEFWYRQKQKQYARTWRKKHPNYLKNYMSSPEEKAKNKIRGLTYKKYGKVPKGFHRHHLDYKSPDNFILVTTKEHKKFHPRKTI